MNIEKLNSLLIDAVNRDCKDEVIDLLQRGADLECRDPTGDTPLMAAAWVASEQLVRLLLSIGADAMARNSAGKTALDQALEVGHNMYGHDAVIKALREHLDAG